LRQISFLPFFYVFKKVFDVLRNILFIELDIDIFQLNPNQ